MFGPRRESGIGAGFDFFFAIFWIGKYFKFVKISLSGDNKNAFWFKICGENTQGKEKCSNAALMPEYSPLCQNIDTFGAYESTY